MKSLLATLWCLFFLLVSCFQGPDTGTYKKIAENFGATNFDLGTENTNQGSKLKFTVDLQVEESARAGIISAIALALYESAEKDGNAQYDQYEVGLKHNNIFVSKTFTTAELKQASLILTTVVDSFISELEKGNEVSYRYDTVYIPDSVQHIFPGLVRQHIQAGKTTVLSYNGFSREQLTTGDPIILYSIDQLQGDHGLRYLVGVSLNSNKIAYLRVDILNDVKTRQGL
jgi:hypothetical protein